MPGQRSTQRPRTTATPVARADNTTANPTVNPTRFRAMYSRAEAGHLEEALLDVRSHVPRRTALLILAHDSEYLVRCYGETPESLQSLVQQGEDLDGYLANQRELLELLTTARSRLGVVTQRIASTNPEYVSRPERDGDYQYL